ncbi:MAG: GNAT family N-acetyltransferase [Cyanobacteria bacterium P01_A01_bin.40]
MEQAIIKLIQYQSQEYQQACQLRYELFFAQHHLPWQVLLDERQADYFHVAILIQGCVVAYGQLAPQHDQTYQVCQMVVKPDYQGRNLGKTILLKLIEIARQEKAISLTLNARLTAIGFYKKVGFQTCSTVFSSAVTGVPHIKMNLIL